MKKILTILFCGIMMSLYSADIKWQGGTGVLWETSSNWVGGVAPGISDKAIIDITATVRLTSTVTIASLELTGSLGGIDPETEEPIPGFTPSLQIGSSVSEIYGYLTVTGNVTVTGTSPKIAVNKGNLNVNGSISFDGHTLSTLTPGSLNVIGNLTIVDVTTLFSNLGVYNIDGNVDFNSKSLTLGASSLTSVAGTISNYSNFSPSNGTFTYDGTLNQTVIPKNYNNLTFSGAGKKTINGAITVSGTFTPGSGEVEYNFASTTTILPAAYGTLTFAGGGEKQIAGTVTASTFNIGTGKVTYLGTSQTILPAAYPNLALDGSGTHVIDGAVSATVFSNSGSSVSYTGASTQNIIPGSYVANLTFSGAGKKVFTDATTIAGTFTPGSNEVEYNSSNTVTVKAGTYGTLSLNGTGTKNIPDGVSFASSNLGTNQSVTYAGTDQNILAGDYNALTFSTSGTKTISGVVTAVSFSPSTSTVLYDGASTQTILPTTYSTLNLSGAGQKNISGTVSSTTLNANSSAVSISGALTATTLNAGSSTLSVSGTLSSTTFNAGTGTVDYSAAGAQTVADITYNNLTLSNSGNKTISAPLSVNNLVTSGTAVLVTGTNNVTVAGDFTNGGSLTKTSGDLSITGNYANNGTLTLNDGILKFGGSASTAFSGSSPITVKYVEVAKTTNPLTLSNTMNIDVSGTFTITNTTTTVAAGGNLVLTATDASNYAIVPQIPTGSSITGSVTAQAHIPATVRTWWHLTNPVSAVAASQWQDDFAITGPFTGANTLDGVNNQSMYTYDETNTNSNMNIGWLSLPATSNTETMAAGKGYRVFIRDSKSTVSEKDLDVTGTLNQGSIPITLTSTVSSDPNADGWNFVGNPYPASLNWNATLQTDLLDINAYVWNAVSQSYSTIATNGKIAPFQGFWVQAKTSGGSLAFAESMKSTGATLQRPTVVENKININLVDKNIDNAYNNSATSIVIHPDATKGFDRDFESSYLSRNFTSSFGEPILADIASMTDNGKKLKVNYIPESDNTQLIPLFVVFATAKDYSLELKTEEFSYGGDLVLIDSYLGKETVFSDELVYNFTTNAAAASKASDRFKIRVGAKPVGVFSTVETNSNVSLYPNPAVSQVNIKVLTASAKVGIDVLDALGNRVYSESINNSLSSFEKSIDVSKLSSGMYFVNVTQNGSVETLKFIIK